MSSLPWWILSVLWIAGYAAILGTVLVFAIRFRASRPKAARLVFLAIGVEGLQLLLRIAQTVVPLIWTGGISFSGDGPDWTNPHLLYSVSMQFVHAFCDIVTWSLLAWAALMRPDETRRRSPV